jgi:nucleoid DNA-binding protein
MAAKKTHLIHYLAASNGITYKRAGEIASIWLEIMHRTLAAGEDITIRGFGRFSIKKRTQRSGRNFRTGEHLTIGPRKIVVFYASTALKTLLNEDTEGLEQIGRISDRRNEQRIEPLLKGRAVVRIAGIPVYEFGIKNASEGGTCLLVENNPTLLRNIQVGQEIDMMVKLEDDGLSRAVFQRSEIRHITQTGDAPDGKAVEIGVKILSRLPI